MTEFSQTALVNFTELHILCLALVLAMFISTLYRNRGSGKQLSNWILGVYACYAVVIAADACSLILEWRGCDTLVLFIVNAVYFTAEAGYTLFWFWFAESTLEKSWIKNAARRYLSAAPAFLFLLLTIVSYSRYYVFFIDAEGHYQRGTYFYLTILISYGYLIAAGLHGLSEGLRAQTVFEKKRNYVLAGYAVIALAFGLLQMVSGQNYNMLGFVVGQMAVFVYSQMRKTRRSNAIREGLSESFDAVFLVDVDTDSIEPIWLSIGYRSTMRRDEQEPSYRRRIAYGLEQNVYADDRKLVEAAFDPDRVIRKTSGGKTATAVYRVRERSGGLRYHEAEFVRVNEKDGRRQFLLSISDASERIRKQDERERQMAVIAGLTDDFDYVNYIFLNADRMKDAGICYRSSELMEQEVPEWSRAMSFHDRLELMRETLVLPEDRESFHANTRRQLILDRLEKESAYYVTFRMLLGGAPRYYQMKFVPDRRDGVTVGLVAGIHNIDDRTRQELEQQEQLEMIISQRTAELLEKNRSLKRMNNSIIELVGDITEARDLESGEHVKRVKGFTRLLAERVMQDLPEYGLTREKVELIAAASALHDVGKIMIPDAVLLKPGRLTPEEFDTMKTHCVRGCDILQMAPKDWSRDYLNVSMEICRSHHEKYDGSGYPDGLKGDEIPISAQIVSVADCFDALVSERVYKPAYTIEEAFRMILGGQCGVFSKKLMSCFAHCKEGFENLARNPLEQDRSESPMQEETESLSGSCIVLVEDSEMSRSIAREILEEEGARVLEACDGREALELFSRQEVGSVDAVLMDLMMPEMDGLEATALLRKMDRPDAVMVPIIALTADVSDEKREQCLMAGMNAYLTKPIQVQALTRVMLECMRSQSEQLKRQLSDAMKLANRDPLTGVKNMTAYTDMVENLSKEIRRQEAGAFALVACDLNDLKQVNDTYGHDTGDLYIQNCSRIICAVFKHSPVYRTGGDEFVVLLQNEDYDNREALLLQLKQQVMEGSRKTSVEQGRASFAGGMGVFDPEHDESVSAVFKRADVSMYNNKRRMKRGDVR